MKNTISVDELKYRLKYNKNTGKFTWRNSPRSGFVGKEAGTISPHGYRIISIDKICYMAHRLAWLYVTGEWPELWIDHRDCNRDNNCFKNLRPANRTQNNWNALRRKDNLSGIKGVWWNPKLQKWQACVFYLKERYYLGCFKELATAAQQVRTKRAQLHKDFARHN